MKKGGEKAPKHSYVFVLTRLHCTASNTTPAVRTTNSTAPNPAPTPNKKDHIYTVLNFVTYSERTKWCDNSFRAGVIIIVRNEALL